MKPTRTSPDDWQPLLEELGERQRFAEAMGGDERIARQRARGRLDARERIRRLCDAESFTELGALVGGSPPAGGEPIPADGLIGGKARIDDRPVVVLAEDFTTRGGSIGHGNHAKRVRLVTLAGQEQIPLVLMLDGAGERASNALERYPYAPNDLQLLADLSGRVPVVSLVLGSSAGHGALCGMFADLVVMSEGSALFTAGPPLVEASLGIRVDTEELGGARMHTTESGVAHNLAANEEEAFAIARQFLSFLPQNSSQRPLHTPDSSHSAPRWLDDLLEVIPANTRRAYDMREVLARLVDEETLLELQPLYGTSLITALARIGGHSVLLIANQPSVQAGAITRAATEKAAHFLRVASAFRVPVVFLADNPGVMAGPEAERDGTLRAAAQMYSAQRALRSAKIHVTVRKAFGFGSSLMAMNPFDRQSLTIAFPGISLGGVPALGGAMASHAGDADREAMAAAQGSAFRPADNGSYDRVIDPRELRNELISALRFTAQARPES